MYEHVHRLVRSSLKIYLFTPLYIWTFTPFFFSWSCGSFLQSDREILFLYSTWLPIAFYYILQVMENSEKKIMKRWINHVSCKMTSKYCQIYNLKNSIESFIDIKNIHCILYIVIFPSTIRILLLSFYVFI